MLNIVSQLPQWWASVFPDFVCFSNPKIFIEEDLGFADVFQSLRVDGPSVPL